MPPPPATEDIQQDRSATLATLAMAVLDGMDGTSATISGILAVVRHLALPLAFRFERDGEDGRLTPHAVPGVVLLSRPPEARWVHDLKLWLEAVEHQVEGLVSSRSAPHPTLAGRAQLVHEPYAGGIFAHVLWIRHAPAEAKAGILVFGRQEPFTAGDLAFIAAVVRLLGRAYEREHFLRRSESLRLDEARYRAIVEDQTELISRHTPDGTLTFVNEAFCRYFGRSRESLLAQAFIPDIPEQDKVLIAFHLANLSPGNPVVVVEHRVVQPGGETRWLQWTERGRFDAHGSLQEFQSVGRDITDQRKAEHALRRSEEQFRTLIEQAPEGIFLLNLDLTFVDVNFRACALTGYQRIELLQRGLRDLLHPDDQGGLEEELQEAIAGSTLSGERRILLNDGGIIPTEFIAKLLPDGRLLFIVRDISERKRVENALMEAKDSAEQANAAKSQFLANMSHELRTPLTGILGMSELLMDSELGTDQRDFVETLRSCAGNLLTQINDLLDYAKIESGHMELESVPFELRPLVEDVLYLLAEQASSKGIELVNAVHPRLPEFFLGDPQRLRQVILNLVGNAIKFTDSGEVEVRVVPAMVSGIMQPQSLDSNLVALEFTVRDTGIGIEPGAQAKLFHAFVQADPSTTRKYGGTGLGLVISKRLVELMGGSIHLASSPGKGSSFSFVLRLNRATQSNLVHKPLSGRALLVVGNQPFRVSLVGQLMSWGLVVEAVADLGEALHRADEPGRQPYDVLVLDHACIDRSAGPGAKVIRDELRRRQLVRALVLLVPLNVRDLPPGTISVVKPLRAARLREAVREALMEGKA